MVGDQQLIWWRSSRCGSNACVEVARYQRSIYVKDAASPNGPWLSFPVESWMAFVDWVSSVD